jgi:hypothetical protein
MSDVLKCCYQEYVLDPHEPVAENLWLTVTDVAATPETDMSISPSIIIVPLHHLLQKNCC